MLCSYVRARDSMLCVVCVKCKSINQYYDDMTWNNKRDSTLYGMMLYDVEMLCSMIERRDIQIRSECKEIKVFRQHIEREECYRAPRTKVLLLYDMHDSLSQMI